MNDPSNALSAAFARVLARTWRGVWLNLIVVALSGLSLSLATYHRPFPETGALTGLIVGLAGYQLWFADRQFTRLGSRQAHGWVRPLAVVLLATGTVLLWLGALAGMHRVAT